MLPATITDAPSTTLRTGEGDGGGATTYFHLALIGVVTVGIDRRDERVKR
jgi:hypothetical protein